MPSQPTPLVRRLLAVVAAPTLLAACATDDVTAPAAAAAGQFTVDARSSWVYVSLADSQVVTPTPSATTSSAWDIAFNATNITLNGGAAGPGGVTGFCLCQNSALNLSNAQWLALTAEGEQADYDAVTSVPAGAAFVSDELTPAISGWYAGSGASAVARPDSFYFVRLSDSSGVAKLRVTRLQSPTPSAIGQVSVEYALAANGAAAFGPNRTTTIDIGTGAGAIDLQTGTSVPVGGDWDIQFVGYTARVNGGISGPGKGAAAKITATSYDAAVPTTTAANAFRTDTYAGVFGASRFYKYNLGGDNRITPTFDVYLIKRGATVYKLQVTGYYSATAQARFVTFRYARIAG